MRMEYKVEGNKVIMQDKYEQFDVFDQLGRELADYYCSMVEQNEKEKGEK